MRAMKSEGTWTMRGATPTTLAIVSCTWFQHITSSEVMWNASPIAAGWPSSPRRPRAKSLA